MIKKPKLLNTKYDCDLNDWFSFCSLKSIDPIKACLDFAISVKEIDFLVIGVQNANELKQIKKIL